MTTYDLKGKVLISKNEYLKLLNMRDRLYLLDAGGVDNWEWYGASLYPDNEDGIEELERKNKLRVETMPSQEEL